MSYVNLVNKSLTVAFNSVKDLATDITFTKKAVTGYDFSTKLNTANAPTALNIKGVVLDSKKGKLNSDRNSQLKEIMLKRQDIGDITFYDSVSIAGQDWRLGSTIADNGYIVMVEAYREI